MKKTKSSIILFNLIILCSILSCKKDKCKDENCSFNGVCIDGTCDCNEGYEGIHCEKEVGYNCVSGTCVYVTSYPQFSSFTFCQNACGSGYSCIGGSCSYVSSGAEYSSSAECESNCTADACFSTPYYGSQGCMPGYVQINPTSCCSAAYPYFGVQTDNCFTTCEAAYNAGNSSIVFGTGQTTDPGGSSGYSCIGGSCSQVSNGAQYASLSICQSNCGSGAGYNCIGGSCSQVTSGAQYVNLTACQNACGSSISNISFVNKSYTDMTITFNNTTQVASPGQIAVFSGSPGTFASGSALTSGKTSQGTQVGLELIWNLSEQFPSSGNQTINVNVSSNYFFIYLKNSGSTPLENFYVNYGTIEETVDYIVISNNGFNTGVGYYKAFSNSNAKAYYQSNPNSYWYWNTFNLPFTNNQSVHLTFNGFTTEVGDEKAFIPNSGKPQAKFGQGDKPSNFRASVE